METPEVHPRQSEVPFKGQETRERYIKVGPLDVSNPKAGKYVGRVLLLSYFLYLEAIPQWVILPHLTPLRLLSLASSPQSDLGCQLFH